jgi:hypothetical protein
MCGLFGFCGDPKTMTAATFRMVAAKIKVLGLYNMERGKHSCGVYMDNKLLKGVDKEKLFNELIENNDLYDKYESGNSTIICHTRAATHGIHSVENAHPFRLENGFVLAHNGVIRNVWELCNKNEINHTGIKVDSLGLAHLIDKCGFEILNHYQGFAALLMTKEKEPNTLYIYRGMSKRTLNGEVEEERPLHYMTCEEGMYVSSMERSLFAIADSASYEIKQLEGNVVHKITNGRFTKSKYHVNRDTINIGVTTNTYGGDAFRNYPKTGAGHNSSFSKETSTMGTNCSVGSSLSSSSPHFEKTIIPMLWHETLPLRINKFDTGSRGIFFHRGRYWIIDTTEGDIQPAHGSYYANKKGRVQSREDADTHNVYFYEGVMMRGHAEYQRAMIDKDLYDPAFNFASVVSKYSMYPVCNSRADLKNRCKNVSDYYKFRWYYSGEPVKNIGITPRFSDRNYNIKEGLLHSIGVDSKVEKQATIDVDSYKAEMQILKGHTAPVVQLPAPVPITSVDADFTDDVETIVSRIVDSAVDKVVPKEEKSLVPDVDEDVTNFYRPWNSISEARAELTNEELNALRYYIADIMLVEMQVNDLQTIFDDRVDVQVDMFLNICVENERNIIEEWDDMKYNDILDYLLVARANPDGRIYDRIDGDSPIDATEVDSCEVVNKDALPPTEWKPIEGVDFMEVSNPDNEPKQTMDDIMKRVNEQAQVPVTEVIEKIEVQEIDYNTSRQYNFEDIIDFLVSTRNAATELHTHAEDDFAQEVAQAVYKAADPLMRRILEICSTYKEIDFARYIKLQIEQKVTS